jgi:DNA-nicking Smr family endonuclease
MPGHPPFRVGQQAKPAPVRRDAPTAPHERLAHLPLQMDRREYQRLKRGKRDPEARIDLHGMTMDRAHPALTRFILAAQAAEARLVLVITGKGRGADGGGPIPHPRGVLRHKVPEWLRLPPLGQAVLQITPAHQRHGGDGAYYVYLRRRR